MIRFLTMFVVMFLFVGCTSVKLPTEKYNSYPVDYSLNIINDSLNVFVHNKMKCPIRILLTDSILNAALERTGFAVVQGEEQKTFRFANNPDIVIKTGIEWRLGKPIAKPNLDKFTLPFPKGKEYTVLQGYGGTYSHNEGVAKYAIDFNMKMGDTICAADEGFIVGIVNKYSKNGKSNMWRPYANSITIYNPETRVFTEYGHLKQGGTLVNIGDFVKAGQPIALAGNTGWSTTPHLHFVAFYRNQDWISEPVKVVFKDSIVAEALKRGDVLKRLY